MIGRDDRIRTCDLIVPNDARYQTVLHPVKVDNCINQPSTIVVYHIILYAVKNYPNFLRAFRHGFFGRDFHDLHIPIPAHAGAGRNQLAYYNIFL